MFYEAMNVIHEKLLFGWFLFETSILRPALSQPSLGEAANRNLTWGTGPERQCEKMAAGNGIK